MRKNKTLLDDIKKVYNSISCVYQYCDYEYCNDCSNKKICDTVEDVIKSIGDLYNEKK